MFIYIDAVVHIVWYKGDEGVGEYNTGHIPPFNWYSATEPNFDNVPKLIA